MPKKKKSDNGAEKIKKRVATMVRETGPSHKEVLEFFKDVVTGQLTILSKVKNAPLHINEEDIKESSLIMSSS